nr:sugar ABC transporter permease [Murimonas intestini]
MYSVIFTDVWKGVSIVTAIYIAGLQAIDRNYYEAASIDGAGGWQRLVHITLPLIRPSMNSVILLSLIGGLRNFVMIWAMTGGGPGFATDVLSSAVYKQYAAGFYGLSTAGNVIMFILVAAFGYPRTIFVYAH